MSTEITVKPTEIEEYLTTLHTKQRAYCEARLAGHSVLSAGRAAGLAQPGIQSYAYEKHPKIIPVINMMNMQALDRYNVSRDDVVGGLLDAVNAAGSSTELTIAWREIGKMLGHYEPEKHVHQVSVENLTVNKLETLPESELRRMAGMEEFRLERDHELVIDADFHEVKEE